MIRTGHLGRVELFSLIVIAGVSDIFLSFPQQLVLYGGPAGWMIPLISMLFSLVVWGIMGPVLARRREGNLVSLSRRYVGGWWAGIVSLLVVIFLLLYTASTMRLFTETVITTVLPKSPISFVAVPFLLAVVYYAYMGVEGLSRVAWFLTPWLLIGLVALLALNGNWVNPEYMFPFWGNGIVNLLIDGASFTGMFINILFLAILASLLRNPKDSVRIGIWNIVVVGIAYALVTLVFIMVFSPEAATRSPFPMYQLGRLIYAGRFIQRLEAAFVFIWVAMALIKLSLSIWISSYLIAAASGMPVYRPLVFPIALIVYSLSFAVGSFPEMLEWNNLLLRRSWTVVIGLPLLTLVWVRFKNRKGETDHEQPSQTS
ncbi:GerAB/ArcD/ProY family transporter [Effusibacillus consociatus]|uniref:Endospore germination permease n=1 Tax=Effusibacillus consociatus TaxID=1117041 RepID=A0ABV9Q1M0_9BACL